MFGDVAARWSVMGGGGVAGMRGDRLVRCQTTTHWDMGIGRGVPAVDATRTSSSEGSCRLLLMDAVEVVDATEDSRCHQSTRGGGGQRH